MTRKAIDGSDNFSNKKEGKKNGFLATDLDRDRRSTSQKVKRKS